MISGSRISAWTLTAIGLSTAVAIGRAVWLAPARAEGGNAAGTPWMTFVHVPVAICTFAVCAAVFVANIGYVWQRAAKWDRFAISAGEGVVVLATALLGSGMALARQAWGTWWAWSPLLTFSMILWILYIAYGIMHRVMRAGPREIACAMYGIAAFLDVPLLYLSIKLLPDRHPAAVAMSGDERLTLLVFLVPLALASALFVGWRFRTRR